MFRRRLLVLCGIMASAVPALAWAAEDHAWLRSTSVPRTAVSEALQRIAALPPRDATSEADALLIEREGLSPAGRIAAEFLIAAALERGGETTKTKLAYASVLQNAAGSDFGVAADARLKWLDIPHDDVGGREKYFAALAKEPSREGWFLVGDQWTWTSSVQAGLQELVNLRANRISFRLFNFLRSRSAFPRPYAYLFVLLTVGIGVKVLALPLHIKASIQAVRLGRLQPEIQAIQVRHHGDPLETQRQIHALMGARGLSFGSGCAVVVLDLIFVIWGLVTLRDYAPQLALDGARFWSVADVTKPSRLILLLWMGLSLFQGLSAAAAQKSMSVAQSFVYALLSGAIFAGIAWYWEWPAYVMIFWGLLTVMGVLLGLLLRTVCRIAGV